MHFVTIPTELPKDLRDKIAFKCCEPGKTPAADIYAMVVASGKPAPSLPADLKGLVERLNVLGLMENGVGATSRQASTALTALSAQLAVCEGLGLRYVEMQARAEQAERGLAAARDDVESWKQQFEMYANAWEREIGPPYAAKRHRIDCLVLTTKEVRAEAARVPGLLKRIAELHHIEETKRLDREYGVKALAQKDGGNG